MKMDSRISKAQNILRIFCMGLLVTTACVVGLDTQTKTVFASYRKKATVKDLKALQILVIVDSVAAVYNLLQLSKYFIFAYFKKNPTDLNQNLAWFTFLFDQMVAYISFATVLAAGQGSFLVVTGADQFEWMKMCNVYTRFCFQISWGILCGTVASICMAVVSSISAFNLFRLYSSKEFLVLKSR